MFKNLQRELDSALMSGSMTALRRPVARPLGAAPEGFSADLPAEGPFLAALETDSQLIRLAE